ncbi:MAG: AlkA N-terminal domain-containing protein [Mycobacteriaceae bacterium]
MLETSACRRAVRERDARTDGMFVAADPACGTYCRPSCPAGPTEPDDVVLLSSAAVAQQSGYRPCRRCVPDAVPGWAERGRWGTLPARALRLVADGTFQRVGTIGVAALLGCSDRDLDHSLATELGAGVAVLDHAYRTHTARVLLQTSPLPAHDVALATGFTGTDQLEDAVVQIFGVTVAALHAAVTRDRPEDTATAVPGHVRLRLGFEAPMHTGWSGWFLSGHALSGLESWDSPDPGADGTPTPGRYGRTLALPRAPGAMTVTLQQARVDLSLRLGDLRDLGTAVVRVGRLLDLDADPAAIDAALGADEHLRTSVAAAPGIRVPGSVDGAEVLLRTVIGQQVSLAAARTAGSRLVAALGVPLPPIGGGPAGTAGGASTSALTHLFPTSTVIAERGREVLTGPARRIDTVVRVAGLLAGGDLVVNPGRDADTLRAELLAVKGIGPWTADYVLMRVLGHPDVLLTSDLVLRQGAELLGIGDLVGAASRWSPWCSYAGMHLWKHALDVRARRRQTRSR